MEEKDVRLWSMLCHLTALAGLLGIPFGNILGPLVVWVIKKQESSVIDENGKESLNFQISMTIYSLVAALLIIVVVGVALLPILIIINVVLIIIASQKANKGESYRYPCCIKFIK